MVGINLTIGHRHLELDNGNVDLINLKGSSSIQYEIYVHSYSDSVESMTQ